MDIVNPYLNFDGNAEEAFKFYKSVFGGEFLMVQRMKDAPHNSPIPKNEENRMMHISLKLGKHNTLMASDIMPSMGHKLTIGNNFNVSINADSKDEAKKLFDKLSKGGKVDMPLGEQFWGGFGGFTDKFGIKWMINYQIKK